MTVVANLLCLIYYNIEVTPDAPWSIIVVVHALNTIPQISPFYSRTLGINCSDENTSVCIVLLHVESDVLFMVYNHFSMIQKVPKTPYFAIDVGHTVLSAPELPEHGKSTKELEQLPC